MAPMFSREAVLTASSPPVELAAALATEFAVLGKLNITSELLTTIHTHFPHHGLAAPLAPLRLAFAAADSWPAGFSSSLDKVPDDLAALAEECADGLWPAQVGLDQRTEDADGLKHVQSAIAELKKYAAAKAEDDEDDDGMDDLDLDDDVSEELSNALVKALDLSIKVSGKDGKDGAELDERSAKILKEISERLHEDDQVEALAQSPHAWPFLLKGSLAKLVGVDDAKIEKLGKEVIDATKEWFEKGPQPSENSKKDLKALLTICDEKTREHWPKELEEIHPKPESLFAKQGASDDAIKAAEKKLETTLPDDYKEFLKITNGFGHMIAEESFEADLHKVEDLEWVDAKEVIEAFANEMQMDLDDDEDDEDEDEQEPEIKDEDEDGPPTKKMKMMDGNKLLAIAKKAEQERGGAGSSSAAPGADADDEEENDEDDIDDAALRDALRSAQEFSPTVKTTLLSLPDLMHEAYEEESSTAFPLMNRVLSVGSSDSASLWLLPSDQVTAARDVYVKWYDSAEEDVKQVLRWAMTAFAGSVDNFKKFDGWAFVGFEGASEMEGDLQVWSGFKAYVRDMATACEKIEVVDEENGEELARASNCIAYSCR